jgi:hypothetical protein
MSEDFIDRTRDYARKVSGETNEQIDAALPAKFAQYSPMKRAMMLSEIERTAPEAVDFEESAMRKAADRAQLVGELNATHQRLLRIGR